VAAGPVFTRTVYGGVVAAIATQNNVSFFFLHTQNFIITCHISLKLANVVIGS
jgi:hypothetical protein